MAIAASSRHLSLTPITFVKDMRQTLIEKNEDVLKIIAFDKNGPEQLKEVTGVLEKWGI